MKPVCHALLTNVKAYLSNNLVKADNKWSLSNVDAIAEYKPLAEITSLSSLAWFGSKTEGRGTAG